jgi:hypothetical protein
MTDPSKTESNKVVQLNVERNAPAQVSQVVLTRLPAAMHSLREKARQQLQGLLRDLFERVDDAMFELADKANNNHDQNIFFDSMREVRIRRRAMEVDFFRKIDISFAQLLDHKAYREELPHAEQSVSLDDLSLVKNDELEEMVASEAMIAKANEQFAEKIQHLTLRIDHLVPIKVYQKNNPLGADVICNAFTHATGILSIDVKAKLVLFKLFDNLVMIKLGALYDALNKTLIDANILPSLQTAAPKKSAPQVNTANHYGAGLSAGLHNPNNSVASETGGLNSPHSYDEQTNKVLHDLRDLLGGRVARPAAQASMDEISTTDLLNVLSQAQHSAEGVTTGAQGAAGIRQLLNNLLRSEEKKNTAINQVDDDVINLVSMMFEFILDDRNLAAPMKALIGRLQIPMVKVAIADKSFFSKGGHPARRLLNEMAMACLGWQEANDEAQRKDGLFTKMEQTVQSVLTDFETDMSLFDRLLVDFRAFLEKEKRRAQILEQRTLDAEDGKAKAERARAQVDAELNRVCQGRDLPASVTKLMREAWANVMFITSLKRGVDSQEWQECSRTAQQLVWSVCATMDKDNRQRLLRLVPELLQKLRTGLESISFSPFETTQLFKQLEAVHLARLRGDAGPKAVPSVVEVAQLNTDAPSIKAANIKETVKHLESEGLSPERVNKAVVAIEAQEVAHTVAHTITHKEVSQELLSTASLAGPAAGEVAKPAELIVAAEAESSALAVPAVVGDESAVEESVVDIQTADAQHLSLVNNITQGTWFEMQGEAGEKYRCRLAAIIRSVGKYIFVNRSGMKVAEESRESLAIALQNKRLTILDDGMLFDRALEAVIGTLRDQRSLS